MLDLLTVFVALLIIVGVVGFFGYLAWKINMSDSLALGSGEQQKSTSEYNSEKRKTNEQSKKKRKDQKKSKQETKDEEIKQNKKSKRTSEGAEDEHEDNTQDLSTNVQSSTTVRKRNKHKATPPTEITNSISAVENSRTQNVNRPKSSVNSEDVSTKQVTKSQGKSTRPVTKPTGTVSPTLPSGVTKKSEPSVTTNQTIEEEQPFTVVGGNRHKNPTSTSTPVQQQIKSTKTQQNNSTNNQINPTATPTLNHVQHEPLAQRQPTIQKETPKQNNVQRKDSTSNTKLVDLVKALPSSQAVVTELMSALDAFPLGAGELEIIMHKIANKQAVIKQDWSKLQHGEKVNPQLHVGQLLNESNKLVEEEMKNNALKRVKELTNELETEKRRIADLQKEKNQKEREIENLHTQINSIHQKQPNSHSNQQQTQTLQLQLQRVTEDNLHLREQLSQQQQKQQQETNSSQSADGNHPQVRVLSEHIKKLSVENSALDKKVHKYQTLAEETQKQKDELKKSLDKVENNLQKQEEKVQELQRSHQNDLNEYKTRLDRLEKENEQLRREDIVHVEPQRTNNNEEHRRILLELLPEDHRRNLSNQDQDFQHWFSSYRSEIESYLKNCQKISREENSKLKEENVRLHKNMIDVEDQLHQIEKTVQTKEETLLSEMKNKDSSMGNLRNENEQLKTELNRLRHEIERVQSAHEAAINEARTLKLQLNERLLVAGNTPPVVADESFELIKQPSPSLSPIVIDVRAEQLNELIRSSKEALENQDSLTQQLDKHLDDIHRSGVNEISHSQGNEGISSSDHRS